MRPLDRTDKIGLRVILFVACAGVLTACGSAQEPAPSEIQAAAPMPPPWYQDIWIETSTNGKALYCEQWANGESGWMADTANIVHSGTAEQDHSDEDSDPPVTTEEVAAWLSDHCNDPGSEGP
jgi:hypothetical protein